MDEAALRARVADLEELVADEPDDVTARFMLGTELARLGEHAQAAEHFRAILARDADYTAAWRGLGRAQMALGDEAGARETFIRGLDVASRTHDYQSGREMEAFLHRLDAKS